MKLKDLIEELYSKSPQEKYDKKFYEYFSQFKEALNSGVIRIAEKKNDKWIVNNWVKKGILLGFRIGEFHNYSINDQFTFYDKSTYPLKKISLSDNVRIVPGGSSVRDGCYISPGVVCMPPMYINVGAYVGAGTMIDSHALVGSCAQIGKRVHVSAAAQIGGVLEPIGALPVIIEDDVLIGGNCGIYEGVIIHEKAVIASGTIITSSTPVYDLVKKRIYRKNKELPLEIPIGAVVVPGSRQIEDNWGKKKGLAITTPVIVKYRDKKTDQSVELEKWLR
jgi:2,3,4,5-tetrahydropyridine-2-carboxylate N-succinyltransferase